MDSVALQERGVTPAKVTAIACIVIVLGTFLAEMIRRNREDKR